MIGKPIHLSGLQSSAATRNDPTWLPVFKVSVMTFGFAIALNASPVSAISSQNLSASDVLEACGRKSEAWISFCHGYMQAIFDLSTLVMDICPPEGTTRAMMAQTVYEELLFLSTQTGVEELQQADGASLSAAIMASQYPCE